MILGKCMRGSYRNQGDKSKILTLDDPSGWELGESESGTASMKISAVNRCVNVIAESVSKLPVYVIDTNTRERSPNHPLAYLLGVRPNEAMAPSVYKRLLETMRLLKGNGYAAILRDPRNAKPVELLPLFECHPYIDDRGELWYIAQNPATKELRKLAPCDVLHYKAYTEDGIRGISVLSHAAETIATARAAQHYENKFYSQNAQPSGILSVDSDLDKEAKEKIRAEWARIHSGVDNAFRIAVLDLGLKYQPISVNNKDAQFVESKEVTVVDIARFFGVPLSKLFAGKQTYNTNEQNGIEYVVGTLHPVITQYQEEDSYKLLFDSEIHSGLWVKRNMMVELKGDTSARGAWYKTMRDIGGFSANDIRELEDLPDIEGGDIYYGNRNYAPLDRFEEFCTDHKGADK